MRRLLRSVFGGFSATVFLFTLLYYLQNWPALLRPLGVAALWPMLLWGRLFPTKCFMCLPLVGLTLTLVYNLTLFSLLTYAVLRRADRRKFPAP
ncbi:MAG TPA: hypothetical protein VEQ42_09785 [Pyrinomonadaceae bacterium]|nr:hypothetical protein [Pyrinomonadaceae bacterium]